MEIFLNQKIISFILVTALIISLAATFETNTVKALATPTITITASAISLCTNSPITLTVTITGGSDINPSSIVWQSSSVTGTFGSTTPITGESNEYTATYVDTTAGTVTISASYTADSNNNGATSNTVTLTIYNLDFNGAVGSHGSIVNFLDVVYFVEAYIAYETTDAFNAAIDLNNVPNVINYMDIVTFVGLYDSYTGPVA